MLQPLHILLVNVQMPLTEKNLSELLDELSSVSFAWRRIGVELGVQTGILEDQKGKENKDALMDMLIFALRNIEFDWEDIASALFKAEERKVARKIREKYCPSKKIEGDDGGEYIFIELNFCSVIAFVKQLFCFVGGPSPKKPKGQSYQYTMNIRPHGRALIINNVKYPKNPRYGSDRDKEALQKALKTLGYAVESVDDLPTAVDIIPAIVEHANKDANADSFICCILAHGKEGAIQGLDGSTVKIADVARALVDSNNSCQKYLHQKPKIFFIQACQGRDLPQSSTITDCLEDVPPLDSSLQVETTDTATPSLPRDSDFFYGFASSFETRATRNTESGSSYIQELCDVLQSYYKDEDLVTMVTRVHYQEAEKVHNLDQGPYRQQPQLVSTLRGQVKFN